MVAFLLLAFLLAYKTRVCSERKDVEARIEADPAGELRELEEATSCAERFPASSADGGLRSLMRLLHNISKRYGGHSSYPGRHRDLGSLREYEDY